MTADPNGLIPQLAWGAGEPGFTTLGGAHGFSDFSSARGTGRDRRSCPHVQAPGWAERDQPRASYFSLLCPAGSPGALPRLSQGSQKSLEGSRNASGLLLCRSHEPACPLRPPPHSDLRGGNSPVVGPVTLTPALDFKWKAAPGPSGTGPSRETVHRSPFRTWTCQDPQTLSPLQSTAQPLHGARRPDRASAHTHTHHHPHPHPHPRQVLSSPPKRLPSKPAGDPRGLSPHGPVGGSLPARPHRVTWHSGSQDTATPWHLLLNFANDIVMTFHNEKKQIKVILLFPISHSDDFFFLCHTNGEVNA